MSMKALTIAALLSSVLSIQSCGSKSAMGGQLEPMPGDDCVVSYNPIGNGYGPKFQISHNFTGDMSTGSPPEYLIWTKTSVGVTIGLIGGNRVTLLANVLYEIKITEGSTTAVLKNMNNGAMTNFDVGTGAADLETDKFAVLAKKNPQGSTNYTRISVANGTNNSYYDVNQ